MIRVMTESDAESRSRAAPPGPTAPDAEYAATLNAEIATAITENLASTNYGDELAARGITTVALDPDGHIVEQHPDGTTTALPPA